MPDNSKTLEANLAQLAETLSAWASYTNIASMRVDESAPGGRFLRMGLRVLSGSMRYSAGEVGRVLSQRTAQ